MTRGAITPALTASEWKAALKDGRVPVPGNLPRYTIAHIAKDGRLMMPDAVDEWPLEQSDRHALAALALYGQPFGFTREDVAVIRAAIPWIHQRWDETVRPEMDVLASIAARLEALLPPETP